MTTVAKVKRQAVSPQHVQELADRVRRLERDFSLAVSQLAIESESSANSRHGWNMWMLGLFAGLCVGVSLSRYFRKDLDDE
jgi:hypothetical protein